MSEGTMARVWVLDTSTKGTGATMVPLETVLRKPSAHREPIYVPPPPRPKAPSPAEPRRPRAFKVIDVMTRQVLAEDVTARATIEVLKGKRSIVDVNVYVWEPTGAKWRLLTFDEQRRLWNRRDAVSVTAPTGGPPAEGDSL
jgi:hypothetical protein